MSFANTSVTDLVASTIERRNKKTANNVLNNTPLTAQMSMKGRARPADGGRIIYEEIQHAENGNADWYSGYDPISISPTDVISASEWGWKQLAAGVPISGREEMINSGDPAMFSLIAERIDVAESTLKNRMETGLFSDGTGSGGNQIVGLDSLVAASPTTGTVGNINRANFTFWRNQVLTQATTASNIQTYMNTLYAKTVRGNDSPDLVIAGTTKWGEYLGSLQGLQRFTNSKLADLGFQTLQYMTADFVLGGGIGGVCTATDVFMLNTKYLSLRHHPKRNFTSLKDRHSVNQDATVTLIVWMGAFTMSGAQYQGRGTFA